MICTGCGVKTEKGFTTSVTDLGNTLVIIRNVPCYKCTECNEVMYTAEVVKQIKRIIETAKQLMQEISVIDYQKAVA